MLVNLKRFHFKSLKQSVISFLWLFALNQLWRGTISLFVCISLVDNAAVAQAMALIKHSAYAVML